MRPYHRIRALTCPLRQVAAWVPPGGTVVDFGCGFGWLAARLAAHPGREVVAMDVAQETLRAARRDFPAAPVRWVRGTVDDLPECDTLIAVDVLYLLPEDQRARFPATARRALRPGGLLLLKVMDVRPWWKAAWDRLQDALVLGLFRLHPGRPRRRPPEEVEADLRRAGFAVERVDLSRGYLHPHLLLVGRIPPEADGTA